MFLKDGGLRVLLPLRGRTGRILPGRRAPSGRPGRAFKKTPMLLKGICFDAFLLFCTGAACRFPQGAYENRWSRRDVPDQGGQGDYE